MNPSIRPHSGRSLLASLVALLFIVAACSGGSDDPPETTTTTTTTTTAPPSQISPTSGRSVGVDRAAYPALVLKIDNDNQKARPQAGLHLADVVYEELVEGGATRFAAIFQSRDADPVGPIRSARSTDLQIVGNLGRPLFGFSGANNRVLRLLRREGDFNDVQWDAQPAVYFKRSIHRSPSNLYSKTADLFALRPADAGPPEKMFTFRKKGVEAGGAPSNGVSIDWGGLISLNVEWKYDAERNLFIREQQGTPHMVEGERQIAAHNVILQFTPYSNSGDVDVNGSPTPEATMTGEGDAWVFSEGKVIEGRWKRAEIGDMTTYVDDAGKPIPVTPGVTWIELVPTTRAGVTSSN